jgi:hypothetical protein
MKMGHIAREKTVWKRQRLKWMRMRMGQMLLLMREERDIPAWRGHR